MEISAKLLAELSEVNSDILFGIHSGSEGECSSDIRMFCLVYIQGRKGSARIIYIGFVCLVYIREYEWVIFVYHHV